MLKALVALSQCDNQSAASFVQLDTITVTTQDHMQVQEVATMLSGLQAIGPELCTLLALPVPLC